MSDSYYELVDGASDNTALGEKFPLGEKFKAPIWCAARGRRRSSTAHRPQPCWFGRWSAAKPATTPDSAG